MRICVVEHDERAFTGIYNNLRRLGVEVVRVQAPNDIEAGDIMIQGSGDVIFIDDTVSRIEIVGQADDVARMAALQRSDFVLERPFEPARLLDLVQGVARTTIPLRHSSRFVTKDRWFELQAVAKRPDPTARDFAAVVSKDLGLSLFVFRLAGSVSSPHYYPTISGSINRIGVERFSRIVRSEVDVFETSSPQPFQLEVLRLAEVARAYIPDDLLAAIAYIVTILSVLPKLIPTAISASELVRLLDGPSAWIESLRALEVGQIAQPVPAAIYAAEHRLSRRMSSATFNLRDAG